MYEIYLHTNKVNGKVYVGLTHKGISLRWKNHVKKAKYAVKKKQSTYFQNAIVKYGSENWDHSILETGLDTLELAEDAERKWVAHYKSNQREFGYNSTDGGDVASGVMTPEVRKKISESVKKLMEDPDRRLRQSEIMKQWATENENPFLGKTHSDKSRKVMGEKSRAYQEAHGNPFAGQIHDKETRARMSAAAKKRCADPNWQSPFVKNGVSEETRKKLSDARKGKPTGRYTIEQILAACEGCRTQKEVAAKLGCTAANISFLMRHFDIVEEVKAKLARGSE